VSERLAVHAWGDEGAPRVVCLHGVTAHGRHFGPLAERLADGFRVLAPDLLGHGDSSWDPPWDIGTHVDALLETFGDAPAAWLGHSFGGRLAFEVAAREPSLVERLVLVDPAILVPPHAALLAAENARTERTYASFAEGIERRFDESQLGPGATREALERELAVHLVESEGGRWRYRYCQAAVVTAYSEMSRQPPPFVAVTAPTLVLLGRDSYLPYDHLLDAHRAASGDRLEVVTVDGGHTVLWDAFEETAAAIQRFVGEGRTGRRIAAE
jgi:lipase